MWGKITSWVKNPKTISFENILSPNLIDFLSDDPPNQSSRTRAKREEQAMASQLGIRKNVNKDLVEQSLLAAAIFIEFWDQNFEISANIDCYTSQLCKIKQTLEKIGPWAKLIGNSLMQGLKNFALNDTIKNSVQQFDNEENVNQLCKISSIIESC
jgi:hypothetical protein